MAEHGSARCGGGAAAINGTIMFIGWLFTIGYLHLPFWRAVLAIIIWPYFLGAGLAAR